MIVPASFQVKKTLVKIRIFEKTFFVININVAIVLNMFFLTLSNAHILFVEQKLI